MARAIALGWFCHAEFRDTIPNFENSSMLSRELPQSNPDALMAAIRALAIGAEGSEDGSNEYGTFYQLEGSLVEPGGQSLAVVTVWICWHADGSFHFVTLKPWRNPRQ